MLRFAVRTINRFLVVADAELVRSSRLQELETRLVVETRHNAELRELLARGAAPAETSQLIAQIGGVIESKLNDAYVIGYHEASRTTAAYIAARMNGARVFRSPHLAARGDVQAQRDLLDFAAGHVCKSGLILEFGVHGGGTINRLAKRFFDATVYGFDSFEGLPEDWFHDAVKGTFDLGGVLPAVESNVRLVKGWFQDTLPGFLAEHPGPVAFCHLDCDLYSSTACVLTALKDRLAPGSVIVFDEYFNYPGWEDGEFRAFAEFVRANDVRYRYIGYAPQWYSAAVVIDAIGGRD